MLMPLSFSDFAYSKLVDPGWPSASYSCGLCISKTNGADQSSTMSIENVATLSTSLAEASTTSGVVATTDPASTASSVAISTGSASMTSPSSTDSASASTSSKSVEPTHQLGTQGIVAIVVCTTLALTSAVLLLLCVLRRRRRQQESLTGSMRSRTSRIINDFNMPTATNSYQPLMSSSHSTASGRPPMTPPLRLRERRLLPSLLRPISRTESLVFGPPFETTPHHSVGSLYSVAPSQGQGASSVKTASVKRSSFLTSPVCTPTARKLEPRQEKMPAHHHHSPKSAAAAALLRVASSTSSGGAEPPSPSSSSYIRLRSPPRASLAVPRRESQEDLDDDSSYISAKQSSPPRQRSGHRRGLTTSASASPPRSSRGGSGSNGNGAGFGLNTYSTMSTTSAASSSGDYGGVGVGLAPPLFLHPNFSNAVTGNRDEPQQQQQQQHPHSYHRPTPPSSPMRPRRPHEEPLEIPDLVRPAAWPTPPLGGGGGGIGVARTTATATAAHQHQHRLSPLAGVSLQSLAEQHRDSWGSWGEEATTTPTGPGRMFGVSFPPGPSSAPGGGGGGGRVT